MANLCTISSWQQSQCNLATTNLFEGGTKSLLWPLGMEIILTVMHRGQVFVPLDFAQLFSNMPKLSLLGDDLGVCVWFKSIQEWQHITLNKLLCRFNSVKKSSGILYTICHPPYIRARWPLWPILPYHFFDDSISIGQFHLNSTHPLWKI